MLFRRLLNMNTELYGNYPEFKEVDMTLKDLADTDIDEAIAKAERRSLKQGISQTAKAMKRGGEAIEKIMRYSGLSRREIAAL